MGTVRFASRLESGGLGSTTRRVSAFLALMWLLQAGQIGAAEQPSPLVTRVGVEYALAGHAAAFAETGIPAVKYIPDAYSWGNMQPSAEAAVDFSVTDRYVREFQQAGFVELVLALRSKSSWASVDCGWLACDQPQPKPEYLDLYEQWVEAVVERYDGDGVDDLPELLRPVSILEIGTELSSYEPEVVGDYLAMLERAHRAAHRAFPGVQVAHAAILVTTAFREHPTPDEYEAAFAAVAPRIMAHSLADIRAVLDRPELFELVNFHALGDPGEIEDTVAWLEWEMAQRGYERPIIISDTATTPFIAWGAATRCTGPVGQLGIVVPPATENDRCRLADFFTLLVNADPETLEWTHAFVGEDLVKKVMVATERGVLLIDTWSTEDIPIATLPAFQAGAGMGAWAGMVEATANLFTGERVVHGRRPAFYALQQVMSHLGPATTIRRLDQEDPRLRVYELGSDESARWVAWLDAGVLLLPDDPVPSAALTLTTEPGTVLVESLVTRPDQTAPDRLYLVSDGELEITVTPSPSFVVAPAPVPSPRRPGGRHQGAG